MSHTQWENLGGRQLVIVKQFFVEFFCLLDPRSCAVDICVGRITMPRSQVRTLRFSDVAQSRTRTQVYWLHAQCSVCALYIWSLEEIFNLISFGSYFVFHMHCANSEMCLKMYMVESWWFWSDYFIEIWKCLIKTDFFPHLVFYFLKFPYIDPTGNKLHLIFQTMWATLQPFPLILWVIKRLWLFPNTFLSLFLSN